ncbi:hypothetical protein Y032_0010g874 [Ancylostoma ceylanicum]|uniref:Uncharacterized protein n=1 Tax=Ancylostoma ceylanicum TaxID=53326 RepID=A0A016VG90_9BILA|nr:hypothetical protein Y032_0010g874 [Ancylostoma ceylanicum]
MWDAPRIRLHLSIVEALNAYVTYSDLRRASDEPRQCFILPDSIGTNLPTPEGWMAWLATVGIESSTVCVRSEPLTIAPHAPVLHDSCRKMVLGMNYD